MINLDVSFDTTLVRACREGGSPAVCRAWERLVERRGLQGLPQARDLFDGDAALSADRAGEVSLSAERLAADRERSVERIRPYLPPMKEPIRHELTVVLAPFARANFGPSSGLQVFSVHPEADPEEASLFLSHVYYHEITPLCFTRRCRRASRDGAGTRSDLKYWIQLLVRNEGIANFAVLEPLLRFRDEHRDYSFRYFTYAPRIGEPTAVATSWEMLLRVFEALEGDPPLQRGDVVLLLKSKLLPAINLVGIEMARTVFLARGLPSLIDVHRRSAEEFFRLHAECVERSRGPRLEPATIQTGYRRRRR